MSDRDALSLIAIATRSEPREETTMCLRLSGTPWQPSAGIVEPLGTEQHALIDAGGDSDVAFFADSSRIDDVDADNRLAFL